MKVNKLNVLTIIPSGFCFGLQHVTINIFRKFDKIDSLFLVTRWSNGDFEKLLDARQLKYTYSWLGMFSRVLDWYNLKMSLHSLSKIPKLYYDFFRSVNKFKPDVLFFANHHELILLYPVLKFIKTPVVCHMHDPSPAIPFQKKTFAYYGAMVDHFIAISDNVRQRTIDLGCPPEKITTIHNGIELPANERTARGNDFTTKFGWGNNTYIVGITGQMTATKGHMDLLNAFKIAYKQNPKMRLAIGGKFIEPLYNELKVTIKEWGMNDVVGFTGWLPSVDLFFKNIDLFVLASRHDEGYGLVVAEAMAHSLPVVITHSGGAIEIVEDGETGYIVPKQNVNLMAERIAALSLNVGQGLEMGKKGRQNITKNFDLSVQSGIIQELLFKVKNVKIRQ